MDNNGKSNLIVADLIRFSYEDVMISIKKGKANIRDQEGATLLHWCCYHEHLPVINLLLNKGVCVNVKSNSESTPLHLACDRGNAKIIALLLERGADINAVNNHGNTPLYVACYHKRINAISLLMKEGANINIKNNRGISPFQEICKNGSIRIMNLFLELCNENDILQNLDYVEDKIICNYEGKMKNEEKMKELFENYAKRSSVKPALRD